MENVHEYLKAHKGQATVERLLLLVELILFENEYEITKPVYSIIENYFRDFAKDTHENYGNPTEAVEQYMKGIEIAQEMIYGIDKDDYEAFKNRIFRQREYIIAALKFAQWALLQDDELTDTIHQAVYDYYDRLNKETHSNELQAAIGFAEDLAEVNAIFDTFDTGDNMGARCELGAIIEALENGTGADA